MNKRLEHICALDKTLELFQDQLGRDLLNHFTCLAERKKTFTDLHSNFTIMFAEFSRDEMNEKLSAHHFDLAVEGSPDY